MDPNIDAQPFKDHTVLVTGAARRLGHAMSLAIAKKGGNIIIQYNNSKDQAELLVEAVEQLGSKAWMIGADLSSEKGPQQLCEDAFSITPVSALINNASIFQNQGFTETTLFTWQEHLQINLTAPFLLSQSFARQIQTGIKGRIINMLDWRALRPGADHFAYSVSKAALASLTKSMALALAPDIAINAIALGAILPPENENPEPSILQKVPLKRWAYLAELENLIIYLLSSPPSLTGQIIHLDGGRHLIR
jgi:NAD(P)-dependent dehydrogenase (short-subunit alcohol dehydrogenase family)